MTGVIVKGKLKEDEEGTIELELLNSSVPIPKKHRKIKFMLKGLIRAWKSPMQPPGPEFLS